MDKIRNLNLICGAETYLMEQKRDRLFKELGTEGSMNFNSFSGKGTDKDEVLRLAQTLPFAEPRRVIYLEDTGFFKGSSDEELSSGLSSLPDTTVIIFFESAVDKNGKLFKLFKKDGEIFDFDNADVRDYKRSDKIRSDIRRWALQRLEKEGFTMDGRDLAYLMELCGYDMLNLDTELEKLICYHLYDERPFRLRRSDIESICSRSLSDKVFDMISAKLSGDTAYSLRLFEDMLSLKVPPGRVLYLLEKQFNNVFVLRSMQRDSFSDQEIQAVTGLSDWQLRKLKKEASSFSPEKARSYMELAAELETRIKLGDMTDRIALELLLAA